MLPSIPNENAYLNCVVKPIYDLCVEVEGSIMGTTISIEKNNGPIYACCNRSVFPLIISVFKSLVYGGRSFDFQELKSAIHQVFSVPTVFASTRCSMIGPWEAKVEGGVHRRMGYGKQQEYMKPFKVEDDMYSICYKLGFYRVGFGQSCIVLFENYLLFNVIFYRCFFVNIFKNFIIMMKKIINFN